VVATIIEPPAYFADSTNSLVIADDSPYSLEFVLGFLNSKFVQWRFKLTSTNNNVGTNELESLPFRFIDFHDTKDITFHDSVKWNVGQMLDLHKRLPQVKTSHERTAIERQIAATDREIDQLVYQLYGLSDKEIALVEEATPT